MLRPGNGPEHLKVILLDVDLGAGFFKLGLDGCCLFFSGTFLNRNRCALNEFLRLGKTETRNRLADGFDHGDLVVTEGAQNDIESGLLFSRFTTATGGRSGHHCDGSSGADAPLFFESLHEVRDFKNGKTAQLIN